MSKLRTAIYLLVSSALLSLSFLFNISFANAQVLAPTGPVPIPGLDTVLNPATGAFDLPVRDNYVGALEQEQSFFDKVSDAAWKALETGWRALDETAAIAYRTGVRTLLSILANDVGEWIGSGAQGQLPLFHEEPFGEYLAGAVDTASGAVIDEVLSKGYLGGFNLCQPDFNVALSINLGIAGYTPDRVNCTFSRLRDNWEEEIRSRSFLPDFQASFDPRQNDIGAALILQNNLIGLQVAKKEEALLQRLTGGGFKDVTGVISDRIRTPANTVRSTDDTLTGTLFEGELQNTGNIVADSLDVFLSAIARGFLTNLINNGRGGSDSSNRADLFNPGAQGLAEGAVAARARLAKSINPSFNVPGRYNVISQLVECSDVNNPGHNDCVIDDNFATAINRRLTVRQAVDEGLIRGDRPFGYTAWDPQLSEPGIQEGIPYRSILILRTYRIVPVGWELAARYIGQFEKKRVTLNQLLDAYGDASETNPFYGLVDPNWVLVPPDAFCKLAGPGEEITYTTTISGQDSNGDGDFDDIGDVKPRLGFQRNANYCADEQTCIKTDDSGACQFYGYCLEERPSLNFNAASCAPRFSTCATLENLESGATNSYLLNTVDFAGCSAGSVGCKQYATWQRLDVPADSDIRWETVRTDSTPVLLNNQTEACDPRDAGCHAFIRVAGLSNSQAGYEGIDDTLQTLIDENVPDESFGGATSTIHLKKAPEWMGCRGCQAAQLGGDPTVVDIEDVQIINGWVGGCPADDPATPNVDESEKRWPCDIDEDGESKVTPEELEQINIAFQQGTCSTECLNYAPYCTASEVGCTAYTPTNGNPAVTAVSAEQCPNECVGFDVYTKAKSFFDPKVQFAQFIPSTARSCSVADAGCTAFTNLSREGAGGEQLEYYKQIRYCQLPGQNDAKIFYSWEGSDETGYQLRTFDLKASDQTDAPCTKISYNNDGSITSCDDQNSDVIDVCTADNYQQNNDCRQFYDEDGNVTYRLLSRTISVSESCSPLRRTNSNLPVADQQTACTESNGFWNSAIEACIYQAVPGEGQSCRAAAAGCRLYQGGTSANYRTVIFENFETDAGDFKNGQLSSVAADVGGHSYSFSSSGNALSLDLSLSVGQSTTQNNAGQILAGSYLVSFEARRATAGSSEVTVEINHGGVTTNLFSNEVNVDSEWRKYTLDPLNLSGVTLVEPFSLSISTNSGTIYIDNFEVQTSVDTFAVIEKSWSTPVSCYADPTDTDSAYLGCQTYNLSSGGRQNIWDFGPSCRPQAVSCEALIDTQNLTTGENPYASRPIGSVTVPADKVEYVVNKNEYQCNGTVQGCMLLGEEDVDPVTQQVSWTSTNLINNPDRYNTILCDAEDIGCSAFSNGQTTYYFKDPRNKVCEYRTDKPEAGWYRLNSPAVSPDCQAGSAQRNFAPANVGEGPVTGWVGLCPATANSCTEYIDPRSDGRINILENGNFVSESPFSDVNVVIPRGWDITGGQNILTDKDRANGIRVNSVSGNSLVQRDVEFEQRTLYVLSADVKHGANVGVSAYVGLTNCDFDGLVLRDVTHCQAIGGTSTSPPASITQIIRDQAVANAAGCTTRAYDGTCIGDLNGDGQVQTDELTAISSMFAGTVAPVCNGNVSQVVSSPDNSLIVANRKTNTNVKTFGSLLKPDVGGDKFERLSSRIYFNTLAPVSCDVIFGTEEIMDIGQASIAGGHWFKNVSVREADTYYQLSERVDKSSCGGSVNNADCVLLNERSVNVSNFAPNQSFVEALRGYSNTLYDSDNSSGLPNSAERYGQCENNSCTGIPGGKFCTTDADCQIHRDSNAIVKVSPTRQCNAWLSCETTRTVVENGVTKQVCLDIESCRQINDKGECISKAYLPLPENLTFTRDTVDRLKNLSGYTRVGYSWDEGTIEGPYSPAEMTQIGTALRLLNGDFESSSPAGEPSSWIGWKNGDNMKVIADPVAADKVKVQYPMEGLGLLQVNANHSQPSLTENVSNLVRVAPNTDYVLSAYMNTLQFTGKTSTGLGRARVKILECTSNQSCVDTGVGEVFLQSGIGWTRYSAKFTTGNTRFIRVHLTWDSDQIISGFWYVDNIQIRTALKQGERNGRDVVEPQSCKLYPTENAPSCEFVNDEGITVVGKRGYCLTWDSQNPNYCLQWWPVDNIEGERVAEDNVGYDGDSPLYYCLNTQDAFVTLIKPHNSYQSTPPSGSPINIGTFTNNFKVEVFTSGGLNPISENDQARIRIPDEWQVEVFPKTESRAYINGYAIGGLVDRPGACSGDNGGPGCEVLIWAGVHGSSKDDGYGVYVEKNGVRYLLVKWCEATAEQDCKTFGDVDTPGNNNGQVALWIDMAWAIDKQTGNKVEGPFDKLIIKAEIPGESNSEVNFGGAWIRPVFGCNAVVQTVAPDGVNKPYTSRILNSSFGLNAGNAVINRSEYRSPFGASSPPSPLDFPSAWDTFNVPGNQPLFPYKVEPGFVASGVPYSCTNSYNEIGNYEINQLALSNNGICSFYGGNLGVSGDANQGLTNLSQLFVETYGIWEWSQQTDGSYAYQRSTSIQDLTVPTKGCSSAVRPSSDPRCGIGPVVDRIVLNRSEINNIGTVTLSFTTDVDTDQLPITQYRVDWGDGTITTQGGLRLQNRPGLENAITLSHNYSHANIQDCQRDSECSARLNISPEGDAFRVTPRVQIMDNWGWCNNGNGDKTQGFHVSETSPGGCGIDNNSAWTTEETLLISP